MVKVHLSKLQDCRGKRVAIVGDIMLDEYHWCKVNRISPEAPVPVCKVEKTTLVPGGAANVANNIHALSGVPYLFGVYGDDSSGEKLTRQMRQMGLTTDYMIKDASRPTILKSRIIAHRQHVVRVDREEGGTISRETERQLLDRLGHIIEDVETIVLSDYMKGTLTESLTQQIIELGQYHSKMVIVDPKGDQYGKYKGAYTLTPNFAEFEALVKKTVTTEKEILEEGLHLIEKLDLECLVVTRSEKGMSIVFKTGKKLDIPTRAREVFDITGAGDTVIATLSLALGANWPIEEAASLANYAAGVVVGKIGTSTTTLEEIEQVLTHE